MRSLNDLTLTLLDSPSMLSIIFHMAGRTD